MDQSISVFVLGSFVVACSAKVARLPQLGESLRADAFTVEAGGKGFNLAVGAHRLGAKVDGIFAIGNDFFSQLAYAGFAEAGLSPAMLRRVAKPTGSGIGFTDERGENCLAVYSGANQLLSAQEIRSVEQAVREASLVLAQFEIGDDPILEAFTLAHAAGVRTMLNPSPYRPVDPRILERTSVLVLNQVEAAWMTGTLSEGAGERRAEALEKLAAPLLERGPEIVVVTLGKDGAVAYRSGAAPLSQAAFAVNVVDTLGAGDAFTAGLVVGFLEGRSLAESLERAAACGAMVCRSVGVLDALPNTVELETFLRTRKDPS